jgi:CheY-like chemotaxis protein
VTLAALLHPAVIVMDTDRPTMNGIEALISKEAAVHKFGSALK